MIPLLPLASILLATIQDSLLVKTRVWMQTPKEIEDLILTGVLDDLAARIALYFAERGQAEINDPDDIDEIRACIDDLGAADAEIISGEKDLVAFYGVQWGPWLIRVEPWCFQCVDCGYEEQDRPKKDKFHILPTPKGFKKRLWHYKREALYRRTHLPTSHIDGPPEGYSSLVLELWAPPRELDQNNFEAISVEVWKETPPAPPKRPVVKRRSR
jgi:hypothetical protein